MAARGGRRWLLAFAAGCMLAPWLPALPGVAVLSVLAACAGVGLAFSCMRTPAAFLLGALWFLGAAQWQLDRQFPAEYADQVVSVTGTVVDLPQQRGQSVRFVLSVDRASRKGRGIPARVLVHWYRPHVRLEPGSRWRMDLRMTSPTGRNNPGGFDYRRYLLARRIGAIGSVRGQPESGPEPRPAVAGALDRQRQRLTDIIQSETANVDVAALKRALGVADRSAISPELSQRLRQTGTAHLLAISGLHVGMVAGLVGTLVGFLSAPICLLSARLDRRRIGVVAGLAAAVFYAGLAGFTLPTQRALIMLSVLALALLTRRAIAPGHALLLALLAVLVFDPLAPLAVGFWLSFAAVAVLIWAFAWRPSGPSSGVTALLRAQLILLVGLLPLNIGLFGQLIPGGVLANLVAIPLVGFLVLPALLLDLATMLVGLPATPVGRISDFGLEWLLVLLEWVQGLSASHLHMTSPPLWAVVLAGVGAVWLVAPPGWPARGLATVLLIPLLWPPGSELDQGELEAWFLDVGNGLAVLIRTPGETVLYDTGPGDGQGRDTLSGILPDMLSPGNPINRVIVSHSHREHAGGLASALGEGTNVYAQGIDVGQPCVTGTEWRADGYHFRVLHPTAALPDLGRNSSCVMHIEGPGGSLLLTGGIDADVESRLLDRFGGPPADLLQLPAGGHRNGSSEGFLTAVSPRHAVASVARFDRFGRVHEPTRRRLQALGISLTETGRCGALRLRLQPGQTPQLRSMATLEPRFWRPRSGCP